MKRQADEIAHELDDQIDADLLNQVFQRLDGYAIPQPGPADTDRLIEAIRPLMPSAQAAGAPARRFRSYGLERPGMSLLRTLAPQLRLFHPLWWVLSVIVLVAGVIAEGQGLPLAALAPALAVGGLAYSLGTLRGGALEMELACPVTPGQVVLARTVVVLGYHLVLGLVAAAVLPNGGLALLGWCASLFFFAGLMLALTLMADTTVAAALTLAVWAAQMVLRGTRLTLFSAPGDGRWVLLQVAALAAGLAMAAYTLWGARPGRLLQRGGH